MFRRSMHRTTAGSALFPALSICAAGLLVLLAAAAPVRASDDVLQAPAGRRALEILEFINGEREDFAGYVQSEFQPAFRDRFPLSMHTGVIQRIRDENGAMELYRATPSGSDGVDVLLKSKQQPRWLKLVLQVEHDDPHRITLMGVRPAEPPEEEGRTAGPKSIEELGEYIQSRTDANEFSGTVLVAKDGRPQFHQAYGLASKCFQVPNRIDTKYNLASIGKLFTSIAMTQLMQAGKVSADASIGTYLEGFPPEVAGKVTVRQLFNGQSGWGDYWDNSHYLAHRSELRSVDDYLAFVREMPLAFEPGTSTQHSNTGFLVAGAIIEAVTGQSYDDYVREKILAPAGMIATGCEPRDSPVSNLAMGYTNLNPYESEGVGYAWDTSQIWPPKGMPCGGGHSTTEDLLRLDQALRDFRLLSPEHTGYMLRGYRGSTSDAFAPPERVAAWVGGAAGASTYFGIDFRSGYTIVVLSNYDHPRGFDLAREIAAMLGL